MRYVHTQTHTKRERLHTPHTLRHTSTHRNTNPYRERERERLIHSQNIFETHISHTDYTHTDAHSFTLTQT